MANPKPAPPMPDAAENLRQQRRNACPLQSSTMLTARMAKTIDGRCYVEQIGHSAEVPRNIHRRDGEDSWRCNGLMLQGESGMNSPR